MQMQSSHGLSTFLCLQNFFVLEHFLKKVIKLFLSNAIHIAVLSVTPCVCIYSTWSRGGSFDFLPDASAVSEAEPLDFRASCYQESRAGEGFAH